MVFRAGASLASVWQASIAELSAACDQLPGKAPQPPALLDVFLGPGGVPGGDGTRGHLAATVEGQDSVRAITRGCTRADRNSRLDRNGCTSGSGAGAQAPPHALEAAGGNGLLPGS